MSYTYYSFLIYWLSIACTWHSLGMNYANLRTPIYKPFVSQENQERNTPLLEFRYMQKGQKRVFWGYESDLDNLNEKYIQNISILSTTWPHSLHTGEIRKSNPGIVAYTPAGKLQGLLLALSLIEQEYIKLLTEVRRELRKQPEEAAIISSADNDYFKGHILGYPPSDILFYYQRGDFLYKKKLTEDSTYTQKLYSEWNSEQTQKFNSFIQEDHTWLTKFNEDKKRSNAWIEYRTHVLATAQSMEDIQLLNLKNPAQEHTAQPTQVTQSLPPYLQSETIVATPIPQIPIPQQQQNTGMSWFKKAAIATGLAAAVGALYKYWPSSSASSVLKQNP